MVERDRCRTTQPRSDRAGSLMNLTWRSIARFVEHQAFVVLPITVGLDLLAGRGIDNDVHLISGTGWCIWIRAKIGNAGISVTDDPGEHILVREWSSNRSLLLV